MLRLHRDVYLRMVGDCYENLALWEMVARRCVETREGPDELIEVVVSLRPCFTETMSLLDHDSNPLVARRPATFGRRSEPPSQGFGRVG